MDLLTRVERRKGAGESRAIVALGCDLALPFRVLVGVDKETRSAIGVGSGLERCDVSAFFWAEFGSTSIGWDSSCDGTSGCLGCGSLVVGKSRSRRGIVPLIGWSRGGFVTEGVQYSPESGIDVPDRSVRFPCMLSVCVGMSVGNGIVDCTNGLYMEGDSGSEFCSDCWADWVCEKGENARVPPPCPGDWRIEFGRER